MQNRSPALISTSEFRNESFVMQEMQPTKDNINFKQLKYEYRGMYQVIDSMAILTASSQLRSTGQQGSSIADELIQFGLEESWKEKILQYAIDYCRKVKADYKIYLRNYWQGAFKKT